jgi:hypothetical protein
MVVRFRSAEGENAFLSRTLICCTPKGFLPPFQLLQSSVDFRDWQLLRREVRLGSI